MDAQALRALLDNLIAGWENEVAELKRAGNYYSTDNIGKYFSALASLWRAGRITNSDPRKA